MTTPADPPPIPSSNMSTHRRRSSAYAVRPDDSTDTCRICRGEAAPGQPLFYPCKCSGSIKYVHQDCLMEWLAHSQKKYCELCKTPFRFTKLYDQSMPATVPWPLFFRQAAIHSGRALGRWTRYVVVLFVWLCWLPWTIRQIWRALFWMADGSWLSQQEMQAAVDVYTNHMGNASLNASVHALNATAIDATGISGVGFFSTLIAILGLLDPQIFLRSIVRAFVHLVVNPTVVTEPAQWENAFLFAPLPRPPSLLSDYQLVAAATSIPILNNALIDVLEGQLICLAIVAAFILVFLIREWVINQQPLLHMPEDDQADNNVQQQPQNEQRQVLRRRRRGIRRVADGNLQPEHDADAPADLEHEFPRPVRRATDNNILVQDNELVRPVLPQRAATLLPHLDQLELSVRELGQIGDRHIGHADAHSPGEAIESPPLERGAFDSIGHIQRVIAEENARSVAEANITENTAQRDAAAGVASPVPDASGPEMTMNEPRSLFGPSVGARDLSQEQFTFRAPQEILASKVDSADSNNISPDDDWMSESDLSTDIVVTPVQSASSNEASGQDAHEDEDEALEIPEAAAAQNTTDSDTTTNPSEAGEILFTDADEPETFWGRISKWLWQTDDFVPIPPPNDDYVTEIVADVNAEAPFVPVHRNEQLPAQDAPQPPEPNMQNGINVNDQNAIDEAEDLEGVLELIGMEGPIAGIIQNIIFSVFLITLTLSASVWCPYIWGKIALLFIAHPISVFFKAPLFMLSRIADFVIDVGLFTIGMLGLLMKHITTVLRSILMLFSPKFSYLLDTNMLEKYALNLSRSSGDRLEGMVTRTLLGFRPDLPTFSIQSHHVLRVFGDTITSITTDTFTKLSALASTAATSLEWQDLFKAPLQFGSWLQDMPKATISAFKMVLDRYSQLQNDLRPISFAKPEGIDYTLVQWSPKEKIACICLGYMLFATAGALYIKFMRWQLGLKENEKVPGFVADSLTQAGGVMKVIVIIGIEMIAFPLYCGTMLDIALLPVFEHATLYSRFQFFISAPFTALFIHWFVGTCYMFHFALFVSMCRKVMRTGVLYFIRDPDDPSFHPVRDVLERPVMTQLGKIAFSAFVYGSLLVICLGGVVTGLNRIGDILPVRWGALDPPLIIPGDVIFYNFVLPVILRKVDISGKVSAIFNWWFRACAAGLRLSDFMFGIDAGEEKQAGTFLWHRFFKSLCFGIEIPKHPMVKKIEDLANDKVRLLWVEAKDGVVDDERMRKVFPNLQFKIIHLIDDKAQALVHFDGATEIRLINAGVESESSKDDSNITIRKVADMKVERIELPGARKQPVDPASGSYVRAPAKDSARIPKGTDVFVQVNENNDRTDGGTDSDTGLHGRKDERFTRIFLPNHFRARIITFIGMVWVFATVLGLAFTVGPLIVGRTILGLFLPWREAMSDLYTITVGAHVFVAFIYAISNARQFWITGRLKFNEIVETTKLVVPRFITLARKAAKLAYLITFVGFVLPMILALVAELYINIPAYTYLVSLEGTSTSERPSNPLISSTQGTGTMPVIHVLQTWALGLIYLRALLRLVSNAGGRPASALSAITRDGYANADIKLASRALILPIVAAGALLVIVPPSVMCVASLGLSRSWGAMPTYKYLSYSYPCMLFAASLTYTILRLQARIEAWRVKIRDEVYLIGERLHNFPVQEENEKKKASEKRSKDKGKGKAVEGGQKLQSQEKTPSDRDVVEPVAKPVETISSSSEEVVVDVSQEVL